MKTKIYLGFIIGIISFLIYESINQNSHDPKAKRLDCLKQVTSFEKLYEKELKSDAIKALLDANFIKKSKIEYSTIMKSKLIDIMDLNSFDKIVENILIEKLNIEANPKNNPLLIDYYIYENDKEDSNKKNKDALLYAGYVVFEFFYNDKKIYKVQIDYLNDDASDLERRVQCAIDSFLSL